MTQKNLIFFNCGILLIMLISLPKAKLAPPPKRLNCTINGLTHNYLEITDPVYDEDPETTIPYTYNLHTENVSGITSPLNLPVSIDPQENLFITIKQLDEKTTLTQKSGYHFNIALRLQCIDGAVVEMNTVIPFIDSNNHEPFFSKPTYVYDLISTLESDFKRLLDLNSIVATDYDITNRELLFSVQENEYFDVVYGGIVPGTLNKQHLAQLVPKFPGKIISSKIEVALTVTDTGNPPRSNTAKLVINPPSPPKPVFTKPFYVGHLYKNNTFVMSENLHLQEGASYYETKFSIQDSYDDGCSRFFAHLVEEEIMVAFTFYGNAFPHFYERNYIVCPVEATYTDRVTNLVSSGTTILLVEYHHDL
ncbi:uncharacterized protein LOC135133683 [Zophobas morio]|uniref:uncharacterized protein LOC135133683 n=1 Tax=Zophobas morio TaxID=2755281 RepID=UPI0030827A97